MNKIAYIIEKYKTKTLRNVFLNILFSDFFLFSILFPTLKPIKTSIFEFLLAFLLIDSINLKEEKSHSLNLNLLIERVLLKLKLLYFIKVDVVQLICFQQSFFNI